MRTKIKNWHIGILAIFAMFFTAFISVFTINATTDTENTPEDSKDNWTLDISFYDSSVNGGKTALKEINWDASDGTSLVGTSRIITVQIIYANLNPQTSYAAGELQMTIPKMLKDPTTGQIAITDMVMSVNDGTNTGEEWDLVNDNFTIANANPITTGSSFQGSLQIVYVITPQAEIGKPLRNPSSTVYYVEHLEESCKHNYSEMLQATLIDTKTNTELIKSNEITFNYTRTYTHTWSELPLKLDMETKKIQTYDAMPSNAANYYWVIYDFDLRANYSVIGNGNDSDFGYLKTKYPYIGLLNFYLECQFPTNCLLVDEDFNIISGTNGYFRVDNFDWDLNHWPQNVKVYVGYPKTSYSTTATVTNTFNIYANYENTTTYKKAVTVTTTLIPSDFAFSYSGSLYSFYEYTDYVDPEYYLEHYRPGKFYSEFLLNPEVVTPREVNGLVSVAKQWYSNTQVIYQNKPMTVRIGNDLNYITASNGTYRKLTDDEYFISYVSAPYLWDMHSRKLDSSKYPMKLYVRYAGESQYVFYRNINQSDNVFDSSHSFDFVKELEGTGKKVVGIYFQVENLDVSLSRNRLDVTVVYKPKNNISTSGSFYNFSYLQVFEEKSNGTLSLLNKASLDNYYTPMSRTEIANYDLATYGNYIQRDYWYQEYSEFEPEQEHFEIAAYKEMNKAVQNAETREFEIETKAGFGLFGIKGFYNVVDDEAYLQNVYFDYNYLYDFIEGFYLYDLLPVGMDIKETEEELLNNITYSIKSYASSIEETFWKQFYTKDGIQLFQTPEDMIEFFKNHSEINIIKNWNGTGRTKLEWKVNFVNTPLFLSLSNSYVEGYGTTSSVTNKILLKYTAVVSYDNFAEYGGSYPNRAYTKTIVGGVNNTSTSTDFNQHNQDIGNLDSDAVDIDENGNTSEYLSTYLAEINIIAAISTHQSIQTQAQTDLSNFNTGIVDSSPSATYKYKLKVTTGTSDITDFILYTNIEEAQKGRTRWRGTFLGVDTSFATSKGYTIKVWYSSNKNAKDLNDSTSGWQLYTTSVPANSVKSLAFQYLDSNGNAATIPKGSLLYVIINMRAPSDESLKTLARMDCRSAWTAIDDYGRPVGDITGLNSNVVKIALPNSVKTDDLPNLSLNFIKEYTGTTEDLANLKLENNSQIFKINLVSLTPDEQGKYHKVSGILNSNTGLVIANIPIGTYLLSEENDNYFDFVDFIDNNPAEIEIEGVTFEKTDQGYVVAVKENLQESVAFNIKVTNAPEPERYYEHKSEVNSFFLDHRLIQ